MTGQRETPTLNPSEFGRLTQLSRKALRLYEQHGLLLPAAVDDSNGYRSYHPSQLARARRIRLLRLMEMPLAEIADVLACWQNEAAVRRLIHAHVARLADRWRAAQLAARLLAEEFTPQTEQNMDFKFERQTYPAQQVAYIRRQIAVPAFHEWIMPALQQLRNFIEAGGAQTTGDPLCLYYGPVNESDDGPVAICWPFKGTLRPAGEIQIRELPAHHAITVRTFGEYNRYPDVLEMWNALSRAVDEQQLSGDFAHDNTTYEIWHDDETMTIVWPVLATEAQPAR